MIHLSYIIRNILVVLAVIVALNITGQPACLLGLFFLTDMDITVQQEDEGCEDENDIM